MKIPELPAIESIEFIIQRKFENLRRLDDLKYSFFFGDMQC